MALALYYVISGGDDHFADVSKKVEIGSGAERFSDLD